MLLSLILAFTIYGKYIYIYKNNNLKKPTPTWNGEFEITQCIRFPVRKSRLF